MNCGISLSQGNIILKVHSIFPRHNMTMTRDTGVEKVTI